MERRHSLPSLVALLLFAGCTESGLSPIDPGTVLPDDDDDAPEVAGCDELADAMDWTWAGSEPFGHEADPADEDGAPFWQPGYDAGAWSVLTLPDAGMTPQGTDRAYRAEFTLDVMPPILSVSVQSDDGLWLWVNGVEVGHWGGEWQEEGCVNDRAECLETTTVDPLDVTDLLRGGRNVVAARVSNPVMNTYFDVLPECLDPT